MGVFAHMKPEHQMLSLSLSSDCPRRMPSSSTVGEVDDDADLLDEEEK